MAEESHIDEDEDRSSQPSLTDATRSGSAADAPGAGDYALLVAAPNPLTHVTDAQWSIWLARLAGHRMAKQPIGSIAAELRLPWPNNRSEETLETYFVASPEALTSIPALGRKKLRTIVLCIAHAAATPSADRLSQTVDPAAVAAASEVVDGTCEDIVQSMLGILSERELRVIAARSGWYGAEPKSLAEIGLELAVTRERVRQIEALCIAKLRRQSSLLHRLELALWRDAARLWDQLAGHHVTVDAGLGESKLLSGLAPAYRLSTLVLELTASQILDRIAQRVGTGWHRSGIDRILLEHLANYLDSSIDLLLPVEAEHIARIRRCPVQAVRVAAGLASNATYYSGYISRGRPTSRVRRAVWLHRLLATHADEEATQTRELFALYRRLPVTDQCTIRDIEIVLQRHTHLFIPMGRDAWRAIGGRPTASNIREAAPPEPEDVTATHAILSDEDDTLVSQLRLVLDEAGPLPQAHLDTAFRERTQDRFSLSGAHAVLIASGEFVRVAPGVYGLPEHLNDPAALDRARHFLLNEESCATYVRARFAGEPAGAFPLWDQKMEHEWCQWARHHGSEELFRSLLWVATGQPDGHETVGRQEYWLDSELAPILDDCLPPLEDLLPVLAAASIRAHLGWVGVNRLLRRRQNDKTTLNVLALLVGLGALLPSDDWRAAHAASNGAALELYERLAREIHTHGVLTWRSEIGREFGSILRTCRRKQLGWASADQVANLRMDASSLFEAIADEGAVLQAVVDLAIATSQADGHVDAREENLLRVYIERPVATLSPELAHPIERAIQEMATVACDVNGATTRLRRLSVAVRREILTMLFDVAAADGIFRVEEERILQRICDAIDVDSVFFAALYQKHRAILAASDEGSLSSPLSRNRADNVDQLMRSLFQAT